MAKHAPFAMDISISSCFAATWPSKQADSLPVVLSATVLGDSMKTSTKYSGCKNTCSSTQQGRKTQ